MRLPIVCLDPRLRQFLSQFAGCFSRPQYKYFVTILLGLMLCQSGRTLSGLLQQVNSGVSLSGASRFMGQVPWQADDLARQWQSHFRQEMTPQVQAEHARLRRRRKKKRGRPHGRNPLCQPDLRNRCYSPTEFGVVKGQPPTKLLVFLANGLRRRLGGNGRTPHSTQ